MSDEQQVIRHPMETMDDVTEVSSTAEIERRNTFMITKNTEARSKTVISVLVGGAVGLMLCLIVVPFLGYTVGAVIILICLVATPLLMVGTVKDPTQQVRWKRLLKQLQSRNIEGQVFYPNSNKPENLTSLEEMQVR